VGGVTIRKSWCVVWVGLGLVLCLAGCQTLFPKPAYTPPRAPAPAAPPPPSQVVRPTFYVAVSRLNLRACPGMDCPKIAVIERNEEVEKLGEAEDWSQIRIKRDGTIGWVSSRYLSATPVVAPPEAAPPLPEPEKVKPTPEKPPAVEMPKPAKPAEGPTPAIKKKPEEVRPAKPAKPVKEEAPPAPKPAPEESLIPEKPAKPAPPAAKPTPPEKPTPPPAPEPEKPSQIRIM
jgi:uncharacterized protein YgiM (DUF1202 family)